VVERAFESDIAIDRSIDHSRAVIPTDK
jgi:hypothetical protein